ncbi:MAG: hypothetical protein WCO84_02670 [bacterium]
MKDKEAATILLNLAQKYPLTKEEKEAISSAIGILSWSSLAEGRIKSIKKNQKKNLEM